MRLENRQLTEDIEQFVKRQGKRGCTATEIPFCYHRKALRYLQNLQKRKILFARPVGNNYLFFHKDAFSPYELETTWGVGL